MSENINPDVQKSEVVDYSGKSLAELSELFHQFATSEDRLQRAKEAEALKSAFYKTLLKEKEKVEEAAQGALEVVEENFKALYTSFKKEKASYNKQLDAQKEDNLKAKQAVIEDLKALLEKDEDVSTTLPDFRAIQDRWRGIGAVPAQNFRDINNTYQLYVEQFYDRLKINRELRDLDFRKNLEAKQELCEKAEKLSESDNIMESFKELQRLHDAWKDLGPVAKQYREEIWERFKVATAVINKKYQGYFETMKGEQEENLAKKQELCVKVEEIAEREIADSKLWNSLSKDIEAIQAEWRKIGYATRKENQKIYERFRAACDKFYERKRDFYASFKDDMEENLRKKTAICEAAEELKSSREWKKATDQLIDLQKKWKEIGAVPRKKSDALWKRFRAACDEFFEEKEKNFKESREQRQGRQYSSRPAAKVLSEKDKLVARYRALEQEIATKENNILFFAQSAGNAIVEQMKKGIEDAKQELKSLEEKIRSIEEERGNE